MKLPSGRVELIREARAHVAALYQALQRLWAPYLFGSSYTEARNRVPTLAELGVENPWILTDPKLHAVKKGNADAVQQLTSFWTEMSDPSEVVRLAKEVASLIHARRLRRRTGRGYGTVPWPSQFMVRRAFEIDGTLFTSGELVAFLAKRGQDGKYVVSLRRTGKLTHVLDLLGIR
jgi:hypothetical protein